MILTKVSQVQRGMIVYRVHLLSPVSFITCYELVTDPCTHSSKLLPTSYFVDGLQKHIPLLGVDYTSLQYDQNTTVWKGHNAWMDSSPTNFSLRDAGIDQQPRYNDHGLFDNLNDAIAYVEKASLGGSFVPVFSLEDTTEGKVDEDSTDQAYERAMRGI